MKNHRLFTIEHTLADLAQKELKRSSALSLRKLWKAVSAETTLIREVVPRFLEFEQKFHSAAKDDERNRLLVEYQEDIKQAEELFNSDFSGTLPIIKLSELLTPSGEEIGISAKQIAILEPVLDLEEK